MYIWMYIYINVFISMQGGMLESYIIGYGNHIYIYIFIGCIWMKQYIYIYVVGIPSNHDFVLSGSHSFIIQSTYHPSNSTEIIYHATLWHHSYNSTIQYPTENYDNPTKHMNIHISTFHNTNFQLKPYPPTIFKHSNIHPHNHNTNPTQYQSHHSTHPTQSQSTTWNPKSPSTTSTPTKTPPNKQDPPNPKATPIPSWGHIWANTCFR